MLVGSIAALLRVFVSLPPETATLLVTRLAALVATLTVMVMTG
jgi:hypothetical protein